MKISPWTMMLTMLAGWVNQQQQDVIEYLKEENAILKEKLGKKRLILSDEQRRRLAVLAKRIGRNGLNEICGIFSPETLMKWHRALIARKYSGSHNRKLGRPRIRESTKRGMAAAKAKGVKLGKRPKLFAKDIVPLLQSGLSIKEIATKLAKTRQAIYTALKRESIDLNEVARSEFKFF